MYTDPAIDGGTTGRRTRQAWYAYDLGNTAVEFAIPLYFTIWVVTDLGVPAWIFGLVSAVSSWAIGLSGPYIGVYADERQKRRRWFVRAVICSALLLMLPSVLPHTGTAALATILVVAGAANYLFQLSSLIYNASMLRAAGEANIVSVSSLGLSLSFVGGAVGVGICELLASGQLIPGVSGRQYALIPAGLIFVASAIPSMLTDAMWQEKGDAVTMPPGTLHQRMKVLWKQSSRQYRAGWFLAGYFMLNSSVMGLTIYLPLYVQRITGFEGVRLLAISGVVVIMSAVGAGIVAFLKPDGPLVRRIILIGLVVFGLNAAVFSVATSLWLVVVCGALHGLVSGAIVPTVRGAFAQTFHSDYQALGFGLFGAVQRTSQGLGAALSPLAEAAGGETATSMGILSMGVLALIGVPLFSRWRLGLPHPDDDGDPGREKSVDNDR